MPLLRLLRDRGEVEVVGCYDRNVEQARATAAALGAKRWGTEATPQDREEVDAALIATPPRAHAELARLYIASGRSALIEKPFTATADEARTLVEAAADRGVTLAVDHSWRFHPSVDVARRFLERHLDEVTSVEAAEGYRWTWSPASGYALEDRYGGVIHDTGSHLVDMVLYLLGVDAAGPELSITLETVTKVPANEPSHECEAQISLGLPNGKRLGVHLAISRLRPLARGVKVRGAFGLLFVPTAFAIAPTLFAGDDAFRLEPLGAEVGPGDEFGCLLRVHLDFLRALRGGSGSRTDAARFLRLSEILESLHRGAAR